MKEMFWWVGKDDAGAMGQCDYTWQVNVIKGLGIRADAVGDAAITCGCPDPVYNDCCLAQCRKPVSVGSSKTNTVRLQLQEVCIREESHQWVTQMRHRHHKAANVRLDLGLPSLDLIHGGVVKPHVHVPQHVLILVT